MSFRADSIEHLRVEPRAGAVHRIATRHPKGDWLVARNPVQQVHTVVVVGRRGDEVAVRQQRAWMRERVDFKRQSFLEPALQLGILRIKFVAKNADRRPAVNLPEPVQKRPQERFIFRRLAHVVDGQNHHRFHVRFAHPLRRGQPGRIQTGVEGIGFVETSQPVGVCVGQESGGNDQEKGERRKQTWNHTPAKITSPAKPEREENQPATTAPALHLCATFKVRKGLI